MTVNKCFLVTKCIVSVTLVMTFVGCSKSATSNSEQETTAVSLLDSNLNPYYKYKEALKNGEIAYDKPYKVVWCSSGSSSPNIEIVVNGKFYDIHSWNTVPVEDLSSIPDSYIVFSKEDSKISMTNKPNS